MANTVLTELIAELQKEHGQIAASNESSDVNYAAGLKNAIIAATSYLPKEKQQILAAYDASQRKCVRVGNNLLELMKRAPVFSFSEDEAQKYYTETFEKE